MSIIVSKDNLEELGNTLTTFEGLDPRKRKILAEKMREWIAEKNKIADLDISLNEYLYETKHNNEIIPDKEFLNHINKIASDSLIIHIKKAQIYKVYNVSDLEEFDNDHRTYLRKPENGPVHEVVRDEFPQKLTIMINDDVDDTQLMEIKHNIIEFIKKNPAFIGATISDVKAFSMDGNTEFVLSSVTMQNFYEKDKIITAFIRFLKELGKTTLASKIHNQMYESPMDGIRLYKLPGSKTDRDNIKYNILDQLITTPGKANPVINNITYIVNNSTVNNVNIGTIQKTTNIIDSKSSKKTLKTFVAFIKDNKPEWYKENEYVKLDVIENAYREYFNDNDTNITVMARNLNGILYTKSKRVQNVTKKLLIPFSEL